MSIRKVTTPTATEQNSVAIYAAIEMSGSRRDVVVHTPASSKLSRYRVGAGDTAQLLELLERVAAKVARQAEQAVSVVSCYEAGYDGFWLHRVLSGQGLTNQTGRVRRIAIVAVARKLAVALWRYVESGIVPTGAVLKKGLRRGGTSCLAAVAGDACASSEPINSLPRRTNCPLTQNASYKDEGVLSNLLIVVENRLHPERAAKQRSRWIRSETRS